MIRAALRSLLSHKVRLALTSLSIVLAVAFVTGTYVFTDSLKNSLGDVVRQNQADVTVQPLATDFRPEFQSSQDVLTVPADLAKAIADVPGAADAAPVVQAPNILLLDDDGKPLGASDRGGPPDAGGLGLSWVAAPDLRLAEISQGTQPVGSDQVAIDEDTLRRLRADVGDEAVVLFPDGDRRTFTISGALQLGAQTFGLSLIAWEFPTAQRLLLEPGQATSIRVAAEPGVTQDELKEQIVPLLPSGTEAVTGDEQASLVSEQLNSGLGFLNTFLLVFALVSLFVAAFLIFNTFAMLVAQRTRELALLRAIGASRGQVMRSILAEAAIVGLLASSLGLVVGALFALGLQRLFAAFGAPLPAGGLVFQPRTVAVAYAVGLVVTMISAAVPARRAAVIPPVAAMRDEQPTQRGLQRRTLVGSFLVGGGLGLAAMAPILADRSASQGATMAGVAALLLLLGVLALAPQMAQPVVRVLGAPFRGLTGRLAVGNTRRNPRRTAATAGALTIGVALMGTISVMASSTQASISGIVDDVIGADYVLTGYGFRPFPKAVARAAADTPGVAATAVVRQVPIRAPGTGDTFATGVDPDTIGQALNLSVAEGSLADLGMNDVALDQGTAEDIGAGVGTVIEVLSLTGPVKLDVVAIYEGSGGFNGYVTNLPTIARLGAPDQDAAVYVVKQPEADADAVQADLGAALTDYPAVQLQNQREFKEDIAGQIDQLLSFLFALLFLAVLIAFLGIVNTLALSVFERTRELGLLRAIGMGRSGVRGMVMVEALLISVFGALLGLALGLFFGALLQRVLRDQGIEQFAVNGPQLVLFLLLAAFGGFLASLWPARRASRLRILEAIASE